MENILTFLGKDSGFGKENTSAYAIQDNRFLLIDCGITVFPKLQEMQSTLESVDAIDVIITHLHDDHAGSLAQFILWCKYIIQKPVNLMCACEDIETNLAMRGVPRIFYDRTLRYDIEFIEAEHVKGMDCYGFAAVINGSYVVYTGDTSNIANFRNYISIGILTKLYLYVDSSISGGVHLKLSDNLNFFEKIAKNGHHVELMHLDNKKEIAKMIQETGIQM